MDPDTKDACIKIVAGLKRTQRTFASSKDSLVGLTAYMDRVENPYDLVMAERALKSGEITTPFAVVRLLRRPASNCLRFCIEEGNAPYRVKARKLLDAIDKDMREQPWLCVPPLPIETYTCLDLLETLVIHNPELRMFWARIETSLMDPSLRADYAQAVAFPMDMGRLTSEVLEDGISTSEFLAKAELVFKNCVEFWATQGDMAMVAVGERGLGLLEELAGRLLPEAWGERRLPFHDDAHPPPGKVALLPKQNRLSLARLATTNVPVLGSFGDGTGGEQQQPQQQLPVLSLATAGGGGGGGGGGLPRLKSMGSAAV
eukprot:evm.model.NODE_10402_length_4254_cov_17.117302.1